MKEKKRTARIVAYNTAIETLEGWECDPNDENAEEEMRQAKILADQLKRQVWRWSGKVRPE